MNLKTLNGLEVNPSLIISMIDELDKSFFIKYASKFHMQLSISRELVSFQANKKRPKYRWFKFKEAFSADLIEYLFNKYRINSGTVLDPFAGLGTTLFVASGLGLKSIGIEILPIGQELISTRILLQQSTERDILERLLYWVQTRPWERANRGWHLPILRITSGAYPKETEESIEKYLRAIDNESLIVKSILRFALLCILEEISFTRKDGQYLRWDYRSGRTWGKKIFDKGNITSFNKAIITKLIEIIEDSRDSDLRLDLFHDSNKLAPISILNGSCLNQLPELKSKSIDCITTSPPYCNRYDYTRTYALELAILGVDEINLSSLRQQMLSCTVENREKDLLKINPLWQKALLAVNDQILFREIVQYLETMKQYKKLNNNGIPRMVKGYFNEMACVIQECGRILKPNGLMIMVNDNVRYAGAKVSVDLILSDLASKLGFNIEEILVLPNGKGNSSQQMGKHGREELRKCIYVWRKSEK